MKTLKYSLVISLTLLFVGCSNQQPQTILIQPNISIQMPVQDNIISNDEVIISATISSELFERNDIQHYNMLNQDYCTNKYNLDNNIQIINLYGNSMNPTLWEGNKLICDSFIKDYKSGMIITFKNWENKSTTHRVKAVYDNYIITQGDNNVGDDGRIDNSKIECVVIGVCY